MTGKCYISVLKSESNQFIGNFLPGNLKEKMNKLSWVVQCSCCGFTMTNNDNQSLIGNNKYRGEPHSLIKPC